MFIKYFSYLFLFIIVFAFDTFAQLHDEKPIYGTIRFNNNYFQGATVRVKNTWNDGSYDYSVSDISDANGYFNIDLWQFDYETPVGTNGLVSRVVTIYYPLPCPYTSLTIERSFIGIFQDHSYNYVASPPTGSGTVSGTILVNGQPAPYHTKAVLYRPNGTMLGVAQTINNSGSYSFSPNTTPYGTNRLEVTVYTNPVTVQNFYFCVNEANEVFNPNLTISGYTQGYVTGKVKNNCHPVASQIVYFYPKVANGMSQGYVSTNSLGEYTSYNLPANLYEFKTTFSGQIKLINANVTSGLLANQHFLFGVLCADDHGVDKLVSNEKTEIPVDFTLYQNYPNPFNPSTIIKYYLLYDTQVKIRIVNVNGQEVRLLVNGYQTQGFNEVVWDSKNNSGENVSSGIYFYQLIVDSKILTNKMMLVR